MGGAHSVAQIIFLSRKTGKGETKMGDTRQTKREDSRETEKWAAPKPIRQWGTQQAKSGGIRQTKRKDSCQTERGDAIT